MWLKLQPYVQTSVAARAHHKLSSRHFWPYEIESRIGLVAYRLKLPATSTVHPVFHVSLLKKAIGNLPPVESSLPSYTSSMQESEFVMDRRLTTKRRRAVQQLLIKWVGWPPEPATWEDEDHIRHRLPSATTCGQAVSQEEGNVRCSPVRVDAKEDPRKSQRPVRAKKPNTKFVGPERKN